MSASPISVEPLYPQYQAVPNSVDVFAARIDALYRQQRQGDLGDRSAELIRLMDSIPANLDGLSKGALGIAGLKIYGGKRQSHGTEAANIFKALVPALGRIWPESDSVGVELIAALGKGLLSVGDVDGCHRSVW
ncbi:MAG: hypothetical protein R2811_16655 [Flavobacteriales bacterium]